MMKGLRQDFDQLTRHFSGKLKYVQVVLTFPLSDSLNSSCKIKKRLLSLCVSFFVEFRLGHYQFGGRKKRNLHSVNNEL